MKQTASAIVISHAKKPVHRVAAGQFCPKSADLPAISTHFVAK
jgi:hypothetical protein